MHPKWEEFAQRRAIFPSSTLIWSSADPLDPNDWWFRPSWINLMKENTNTDDCGSCLCFPIPRACCDGVGVAGETESGLCRSSCASEFTSRLPASINFFSSQQSTVTGVVYMRVRARLSIDSSSTFNQDWHKRGVFTLHTLPWIFHDIQLLLLPFSLLPLQSPPLFLHFLSAWAWALRTLPTATAPLLPSNIPLLSLVDTKLHCPFSALHDVGRWIYYYTLIPLPLTTRERFLCRSHYYQVVNCLCGSASPSATTLIQNGRLFYL